MNNKFIRLSIKSSPAYDIIIGRDFSRLAAELNKIGLCNQKACIICDENIESLYRAQVEQCLVQAGCKPYIHRLRSGEQNKNLISVSDIYKTLIYNNFERRDFIIALGGGVTGDIAGFAAATYLRGIRFIQLPTTLLAMVDSSVGGKTGVDFLLFKNLIGAFYMPALVYTNIETLKTLPEHEFASGMAEVVKHALIKDLSYYNFIEDNILKILKRESAVLTKLIYTSNLIKKYFVEKDPKEQGERAFLNFGHTLGHAIEKESISCSQPALLHGECVGIGCIAAMYLSKRPVSEISSLKKILKSLGLPLTFKGMEPENILGNCLKDKKNSGGKIGFVLLKNIGSPFLCYDITYDEMKGAIESLYDKE